VGLHDQHAPSLIQRKLVCITHRSALERRSVCPTEEISFRLAPRGFFRRNPALDVADQR
jgi:Cu2+-containing amine oxidase